MNKIKAMLGTVVVVAGFAGVASPAQAMTSADTTAPSLTLGAVHFRTGAPIYTDYRDDYTGGPCTPGASGCSLADESIPLYVPWTTADPSGICSEAVAVDSYEAYTGNGDVPFNDVVGVADASGFDPRYQDLAYVDRSLVPNQTRRWNFYYATQDDGRDGSYRQVRTVDCAGNIAVTPVFSSPGGASVIQDRYTDPVIYSGVWATSQCRCFSGGSTAYTTAAGASASFSVNGVRVGLVMEMAVNRGSADVYLDGVKKATINTYSATTKHEMVVWESLVSSTRFHTIKVVNKATAGHSRIDVDAVIESG